MSATAKQILAPNPDRRSFWTMNTGGNKVYIGIDNTVDITCPVLMPFGSFDRVTLSDYRGALWGICDTGKTSYVSYLDL